MARSRGRSGPGKREERDRTGLVVAISALVVAGLAIYVLIHGGGSAPQPSDVERAPAPKSSGPALDDIDAKSREKMRDLLREAGD